MQPAEPLQVWGDPTGEEDSATRWLLCFLVAPYPTTVMPNLVARRAQPVVDHAASVLLEE